MSHSSRPIVLSQGMIRKLITNPEFFKRVPEFGGLKEYQDQIKDQSKKSGGCGGCKQKRVEFNTMSAFIYVLSKINSDALTRLKRFLNVEKIQYHGFNRQKGSYELREI